MKVCQHDFTYDDYRQCMVIKIDGEQAVSFHDGEPEDNSLCRNFNDVVNIVDLMRKAHEAGARGEVFEVEFSDKDPDDE